MSTQYSRNRGNLFDNADKRKPSQPDMRGDCAIDGVTYDMQAWKRDEQISLSLAPARGDKNTYPPEAFRGALEEAPKSLVRAAKEEGGQPPAFLGDLVGEELTYKVKAYRKQGKSGPYLSLYFETADEASAS